MTSLHIVHKQDALGIIQDHLWNNAGIHRHEVEPETSLYTLRIAAWKARHILQKTMEDLGCAGAIPRDFGERPDEPWNQLQTIDDIIRHVRNMWAHDQTVKSARREQGVSRQQQPKNLIIINEGKIDFVPVGTDTQGKQR